MDIRVNLSTSKVATFLYGHRAVSFVGSECAFKFNCHLLAPRPSGWASPRVEPPSLGEWGPNPSPIQVQQVRPGNFRSHALNQVQIGTECHSGSASARPAGAASESAAAPGHYGRLMRGVAWAMPPGHWQMSSPHHLPVRHLLLVAAGHLGWPAASGECQLAVAASG